MARTEYMRAFTKAALAGDTKAIEDATPKVQSDYAGIIKNATKSAFEYGKNNAAQELEVNAPANPAAMLRQIDIQSAAIAEQRVANCRDQEQEHERVRPGAQQRRVKGGRARGRRCRSR
jgi:hypothetical protein